MRVCLIQLFLIARLFFLLYYHPRFGSLLESTIGFVWDETCFPDRQKSLTPLMRCSIAQRGLTPKIDPPIPGPTYRNHCSFERNGNCCVLAPFFEHVQKVLCWVCLGQASFPGTSTYPTQSLFFSAFSEFVDQPEDSTSTLALPNPNFL